METIRSPEEGRDGPGLTIGGSGGSDGTSREGEGNERAGGPIWPAGSGCSSGGSAARR